MKTKALIAGGILSFAASASNAEIITIEFTNLTHGISFTPLFFAAHTDSNDLFEVGTSASEAIQAMAESGNTSDLIDIATSQGFQYVNNPVGESAFLTPGASTYVPVDTTTTWDTGDNDKLSVVAMMLPTNDGFVGLDSWQIPDTAGTYTVTLNAYDAGTEANDERINGAAGVNEAGIPGSPGTTPGINGTGLTTDEVNTNVHIHRGASGDTDPEGGLSDLDSRVHRWLNPVARMIVTVQ